MSVDKPAELEDIKDESGGHSEHVNGVQNGYLSSDKYKSSHKSSSKDKHRDKERDRDREHKSSSSKHGSSSSSRDKDRHSSSKSSSHKSSSKDKERSDKDRNDKDRSDRDKSRSDKDKDKKSSDKYKSSDSTRDKDRSDRDKNDKERSDKDRSDKHKSSSSSNDKDKKYSSKEKSSSGSSSRDKSSSSKDKERSEKDKSRSDKDRSDRDKHRSDKDKHSSSSKDKDKRSSNESSRDKTSSKDKSSSHSSSKDKHNSNSHDKASSKSPEKKEEIQLKIENNEMDMYDDEPAPAPKEIKMEQDLDLDQDQYDDDAGDPLANATASSCDYSLSQFKEEPLDALLDADSEEDIPLSTRKNKRKSYDSDSEEDKPLIARKKVKTEKKAKKIKKESDYEEEAYSEDEAPKKKKTKTKVKVEPKAKKQKQSNTSLEEAPKKKKKGAEDEPEVWKWWEEEKKDDGTKWKYLEHKGPLFVPPYERLPKNVIFKYDGKAMALSEDTEEVAGFYAKMLDHDYTTKSAFNDNFFSDWRKIMTENEKSTIKNLSKCDFKQMHAYYKDLSEKNKNKSKEEKQALKAKNEEIQKEYGFCKIDGHKEKIGNFRIEPPGLFRGRGEHPKMGKLKLRVKPEHVIINCSKDSNIPKAPAGHRWKEVRHDNNVTWLASWTENVQGQVKYVMLNPSSKLKGEKDWQKYETARKLASSIDKIRSTYREEWKAKEMRIRQRGVALYFIDRLALRAGNEKDEDQADTVGCCSLRVEHIELHKEKDGREYVVVFDFLGKDSIRYYNEVPVEKRVFKNLEIFKENKKEGDDLFDRLNTQTMNEHLRELMPNLTAKVFRTFNASFTLQNQLNELTDSDASIEEKILAYNRANRAVAVLCNHQRAVPKGHQKSMDALKDKIQSKRDQIDEAEADLKDAQKMAKKGSVKEKLNADKKKKGLERLRDQLRKLEVQETDRDENKTIALGTSKLNYLDPRISIAWCKKNGVPIEKIYNKTQRDKFRWAIDMATVDYVF